VSWSSVICMAQCAAVREEKTAAGMLERAGSVVFTVGAGRWGDAGLSSRRSSGRWSNRMSGAY
jgi:hypothetical protein